MLTHNSHGNTPKKYQIKKKRMLQPSLTAPCPEGRGGAKGQLLLGGATLDPPITTAKLSEERETYSLWASASSSLKY